MFKEAQNTRKIRIQNAVYLISFIPKQKKYFVDIDSAMSDSHQSISDILIIVLLLNYKTTSINNLMIIIIITAWPFSPDNYFKFIKSLFLRLKLIVYQITKFQKLSNP